MPARFPPWLAGPALLTAACASHPPDPGGHTPAPIASAAPPVTPAASTAKSTPNPAAAPAPEAPPPAGTITGDIEVRLRVPAWDALIARDTAILIEPDFVTLAGYDTKTGALRFRQKLLPEAARGRHTLGLRGDKVLYWAADQFVTVDPTTGAHDTPTRVPPNGNCPLVTRGAACAFACECTLQIVDCKTLAPIEKASFEKTHIEEWDPDGTPSSGCFGRGTTLVGGNGRTSVVIVEDQTKPTVGRFSHPLVLLGLDAKTGAVRYRTPSPPGEPPRDDPSFSPDGKLFWLVSSAEEVTVFDAETGARRWASPPEANIDRVQKSFLAWINNPPGLFRFAEDEAFLHDIQTGKPVWRAKVRPGAFAVPRGTHLPFYAVETNGDPPLDLLLLDPANGAVTTTVHVPAGTTVHDDPSGGFYLENTNLVAYDAAGKERARVVAPLPNLHVFSDFVTVSGGDRFSVLDRDKLAPVLTAHGSLAAMPGSTLAGGLLLYRWVKKGAEVGEVMLVARKAAAP
ncbi:outer membrane protein assembly factor BamB family protein [Polyangium mundeleinium]|uniref:PQQ-binding-like beta-propeller repeat protein n=1 Tax=Polyangium mundeleinium TaxID=2995306 RepID=A0ABT5EWG5_9BACT|nr:PQQ-binding-like beta-propeller repeat protein [Polyangium mundeleinium]MDC0745764.1 PQQ-binding-like beta-propeller repeat protein [Polyangium mundeleinium]